MKRVFLIILLLFNIAFSDSVLIVKEGWQLIGVSEEIEDLSIFDSNNVEQVWHFNATTQKWHSYSPDSLTQKKMDDLNITKISKLSSWHGFWIKSKKEWVWSFKSKNPTSTNLNDIIELKKGWNLISLPVDMMISPDIFSDMVVWKYNGDKKWELFDKEYQDLKFPKLDSIKNSEGIWVKAKEDKNISLVSEVAKLHNFNSKEEMENFLKDMIYSYQTPYYGIMPFAMETLDMPIAVSIESTEEVAATTEGATNTYDAITTTDDTKQVATDATNTNLQESDVDESDIIKHNGENIFYIAKSKDKNLVGDSILITNFEKISQNDTTPIKQIYLDKTKEINSIYLVNGRLVVISTSSYLYAYKYQNYSGEVFVDIYDILDIDNIKEVSNFKLDGYLISSRVVDSNLFLVTNFTPIVDITYPKVYIDMPECKEFYTSNDYRCYFVNRDENGSFYKYDYENYTLSINKLTPKISIDGLEKELLEPSTLFASSKKNQQAIITSISKIDISNSSYKESSSVLGYVSGHYASLNSFYLVSSEFPLYFDFNNYKQRSSIYKFNLKGELKYSGFGFVDGTILNQFSLSEYEDILRIATTEGFSWMNSNTVNRIYTLKEQNASLLIEGVLEGLGKEGETIRAVRFMGKRAFVVTFRQTDPFYTIDLSNPKAPQKVGELQVNGYSGYLHPIDENTILGVGRNANEEGVVEGLKIELFDISDFANPISIDSKLIGDKYSYSELENDHKALSYRSSDNLFVFPYNTYNYNNYSVDNYLGLYKIKENKINIYKPLASSVTEYSYGLQRGLIFDMNTTTFIAYFVNGSIDITTLKNQE